MEPLAKSIVLETHKLHVIRSLLSDQDFVKKLRNLMVTQDLKLINLFYQNNTGMIALILQRQNISLISSSKDQKKKNF